MAFGQTVTISPVRDADAEYILRVAKAMPAWRTDILAPYETAEIARVDADLACIASATRETVSGLVLLLRADVELMILRDKVLKREGIA